MRMDGFVFYQGLSKIFLFLQREMIALLSIRKKSVKRWMEKVLAYQQFSLNTLGYFKLPPDFE